MAKIDLPAGVKPPFMGTIQNLCIYEMYGRYYIRLKSSLTGKRVKKAPAFRRTMENAHLLATASKMASGVYRQLPKQQKIHTLYRQLTGKALLLLREGKDADMIITALMEMCQPVAAAKPVRKRVMRRNKLPAIWKCGSKDTSSCSRVGHVKNVVITKYDNSSLKCLTSSAINEFAITYHERRSVSVMQRE
ncbi:MAG TPA: hypothetical protein VM802_07480 [Chitinophaga sp.]|uniref:hypothetical protein n=1 Tax=Chitinophaga sp. TaxID=1869181 RepID=UPI002C7A0154|nr:hypothetical protein [Chitinophaga sp.]HVI44693.1 hypothetical protein [Chitinophaga sp.]